MPEEPKAVVVEGITKSFGDVEALRGISFEVERGSILGILGPNGAGKTTTVDVLSTLLTPDSGRATVAGFDVVADAAQVRGLIMMTGQYAAIDPTLTGRENLMFFGRMMGLGRRTAKLRADDLLERFELTEAGVRTVDGYSGGMRRRLDIACGLVVEPLVVFLDEPTTGLDPRSRQGLWSLIGSLKDLGITTLLTTQYLEEADVLSDNIIVIDKGRVIAEGTSYSLKAEIGDRYCEIVPVDPGAIPAIIELLGDLLPPSYEFDPSTAAGTLSIPAESGVDLMAEVIARTRHAGIRLADIGLRKPSLDDVFMTLTDHENSSRG